MKLSNQIIKSEYRTCLLSILQPKLLQLLQRLVAMVAEHHRVAGGAANQKQLPHTALMYARELAYRVKGKSCFILTFHGMMSK